MGLLARLAAAFSSLLLVSGPSAAQTATDPGLARFIDWRNENALPAIALLPAGPAPSSQKGGNRIGGAVWLPEHEDWPVSRDGRPMTFLAQVDFGDLPPLPDFPDEGILQFFIGTDDFYGADFDTPEAGDFKVIWREELSGPGELHFGANFLDEEKGVYSPLYDATIRQGAALVAEPVEQKPSITWWRFNEDLPSIMQGETEDLIYAHDDEEFLRAGISHHVGGHPEFTQDDYRGDEPYRDVDRLLLQLWSDDHLMWGDTGQGQFTIRRSDLLKRDFSKVLYQWDCY